MKYKPCFICSLTFFLCSDQISNHLPALKFHFYGSKLVVNTKRVHYSGQIQFSKKMDFVQGLYFIPSHSNECHSNGKIHSFCEWFHSYGWKLARISFNSSFANFLWMASFARFSDMRLNLQSQLNLKYFKVIKLRIFLFSAIIKWNDKVPFDISKKWNHFQGIFLITNNLFIPTIDSVDFLMKSMKKEFSRKLPKMVF